MKRFVLALLCMGLLSGGNCFAQKAVLAQAEQFELKGDFKAAAELLTKALGDQGLSIADRKNLEFELDRLARIKLDFPYTKDSLFAELKKSVKGLTTAEY